MEGDAARIGLMVAMAKRLGDQIMLMVARQRRGGGDELLSPLVMPALAVCEALASVLNYAGRDRSVMQRIPETQDDAVHGSMSRKDRRRGDR